MSLDYIRDTYKVPAVLNGRVRYSGDAVQREGTIVGARNAHLKVQLDGDDFAGNYHPTWKMEYLPAQPAPCKGNCQTWIGNRTTGHIQCADCGRPKP